MKLSVNNNDLRQLEVYPYLLSVSAIHSILNKFYDYWVPTCNYPILFSGLAPNAYINNELKAPSCGMGAKSSIVYLMQCH